MNKESKNGILEMSVFAAKIVLCFLLVFISFVYIYFGIINRANTLSADPVRTIKEWETTDRGENQFTFSSTLPRDIEDNEYLFFTTRKDVAVYINGELRTDFVDERDVNIPGGNIVRFYMLVPLTAADSGADVRLEMTTINRERVVPDAFVSTRYGGFSHLMMRYGLSFFLATIVLIFSLVVFIVSIVLSFSYKMQINMMYGALGTFIIAAWLITDSFLFPFMFGVYHVNGILNYMLCLMIPFAPAIYLNSIQGGRYKKSMSALLIASAINALLWPFLHFTGIYPIYNMRTTVNVIFAFLAVLSIGIMVRDAKRGNIKKYRYTFIGFFGFLICCIIEISILLVASTTDGVLPMVVGLGFLLVFVVIQQVEDLRIINLEKQHAIDISEAKTQFLASMSHEIRTPINAILGMNEMILRENEDKVIEEYSRSIKTSGNMLLMLVNDVLDFSKIEAGKLEITRARFQVAEMLCDVISIVSERADEKALKLKTELTSEIPSEMISDEFRIRQILVNLINNAIKYTEKGTVTLQVGGSYTGDYDYELCLRVKDTGKGIRKEEQANLFDAFSRADLKTNKNIEGTGLGLAIVKSIVDSMKGTLGVESEFGKGSEFWVKLPVKVTNKEPVRSDFMEVRSEHEKAPDFSSFTAPDANVLAVDDNQSNLTVVKLFLKRTGIKLDLCGSGTHAIELCRKKKYDLILLDHMMPEPDGIETLHIIREDEASLNKDTKAVVLTANAVVGSRQMYIDAGFEDYLTKPLDSKLLEKTVKKMLPKDKVNEGSEGENVSGAEAEPADSESGKELTLRDKLSKIEELDYDRAIGYCAGDEELLEQVVKEIASECAERSERMKQSLAGNDIKAYQIDAHTIKSNMARIGMDALSNRAKKHEMAADEKNTEFINSDSDDFINEYIKVCKSLEV